MEANIFEIKCPICNPDNLHQQLLDLGAEYKGIDNQKDIYFKVQEGRLKLRVGNIENTLIRYHRAEVKAIKQSSVIFQRLVPESVSGIQQILSDTLGLWKIVDKSRRIYFIDNVKFHIDKVVDLGDFMEIEAIDTDGSWSSSDLEIQCSKYVKFFGLDPATFIDQSYSDMISSK